MLMTLQVATQQMICPLINNACNGNKCPMWRWFEEEPFQDLQLLTIEDVRAFDPAERRRLFLQKMEEARTLMESTHAGWQLHYTEHQYHIYLRRIDPDSRRAYCGLANSPNGLYGF